MVRIKRYLCIFVILLLTIQAAPSSHIVSDSAKSDISANSSLEVLSQDKLASVSKIIYPKIGNPAIVLNGSYFEIRVIAPANISEWNIELYREYANQTVTFDSPMRNATTGMWYINTLIPSNSIFALFDLVISISDGSSSTELIENNAVQVRKEFPTDLKIVHITDTHIWHTRPEANTRLLYTMYQASARDADVIILTGDLCEGGDMNSFRQVHSLLTNSDVPVFVLPGNHDRDPVGSGYSNYMSFFGPDYYTANIGPNIFLVMANTHVAVVNSTQVGWIERDMRASDAEIKILGLHYSISNLRYTDESSANALMRICSENNVDIVLTGHTHRDDEEWINGTLWLQTTSLGIAPSSGGHGQYGFRTIEFQNGAPVLWNWTLGQPWSEPWNTVELTRYPLKAHEIDVGAYLSLVNNLSYSLDNQVLDFLVKPVSGNLHYEVTGAEVLSTVNGTDAFLIRVGFDIGSEEATTIRIFLNDTEPPDLLSVHYPETVLINEEYIISANLTTPSSGLMDVHIDVKLDDEPLGIFQMSKRAGDEWRVALVHLIPGTIRFQIGASDYSGLEYSSETYSIACLAGYTSEPTGSSFDIMTIVLGSLGLVAIAFIVFIIVRKKKG